jgi:hypothetical protein
MRERSRICLRFGRSLGTAWDSEFLCRVLWIEEFFGTDSCVCRRVKGKVAIITGTFCVYLLATQCKKAPGLGTRTIP